MSIQQDNITCVMNVKGNQVLQKGRIICLVSIIRESMYAWSFHLLIVDVMMPDTNRQGSRILEVLSSRLCLPEALQLQCDLLLGEHERMPTMQSSSIGKLMNSLHNSLARALPPFEEANQEAEADQHLADI